MLIREKVRQAAALLSEFDLDCWLTFTRESKMLGDPVLPFLTTADVTWPSSFLIFRGGAAKAVVGRYDQKIVQETGAYDEVVPFVSGYKVELQAILKAADPKTIAVNFSRDSEICDGLTHGLYLTLVDLLGEIGMAGRLVSSERLVSALRERKSQAEIGLIREAIRETQEIFALAAAFLRPGRTEKEIGAFITAERVRRGLAAAWSVDSCPAVFTGPGTAEAHYGPTGRPVEPGHVLNWDFGVKVGEYCSDLQRTFYILRPGETEAPPEVRRGFATIVRAIEAARRAIRPGVLGKDVDAAARAVLAEAGYEEFPHGLGHQVGRFAHDGTALLGPAWEKYGRKPFKPLEAGMVFTVEPRLTVPGYGIVTVEDMLVVTETGSEWLSDPQAELALIGG